MINWSSSPSNKETTVYGDNIATIWMTLKDKIGAPIKQAPPGKAWGLSCIVSMASDQAEALPIPLSVFDAEVQ